MAKMYNVGEWEERKAKWVKQKEKDKQNGKKMYSARCGFCATTFEWQKQDMRYHEWFDNEDPFESEVPICQGWWLFCPLCESIIGNGLQAPYGELPKDEEQNGKK